MLEGVDVTVEAAVADARRAWREYDDARAWLDRARRGPMPPLAAEVWVIGTTGTQVLLVSHRVRGWVPPGGTVEPGETPCAAAARELVEETGVVGDLLPAPVAVAVRSYRPGWAPTLGLSYGAVIDRATPLASEHGQPARWFSLDDEWRSVFPEDRDRIREFARLMAGA